MDICPKEPSVPNLSSRKPAAQRIEAQSSKAEGSRTLSPDLVSRCGDLRLQRAFRRVPGTFGVMLFRFPATCRLVSNPMARRMSWNFRCGLKPCENVRKCRLHKTRDLSTPGRASAYRGGSLGFELLGIWDVFWARALSRTPQPPSRTSTDLGLRMDWNRTFGRSWSFLSLALARRRRDACVSGFVGRSAFANFSLRVSASEFASAVGIRRHNICSSPSVEFEPVGIAGCKGLAPKHRSS